MSIRTQLVEAGAQVLDGAFDVPPVTAKIQSQTVLDAMLDVLTENAVEWRRLAFGDPFFNNPGSEIPRLLAVLREGDEG